MFKPTKCDEAGDDDGASISIVWCTTYQICCALYENENMIEKSTAKKILYIYILNISKFS